VRVAESYLARIAALDPALRTYIAVTPDEALESAEQSRRRWEAEHPLGPLVGIPIALKDNIDVAGVACTAGTAAFRDRVPFADAAVVGRLRQAGAVLLGKLNMHEGALGATTDNPVYGRCINPLRPGYTPGGSSGGSAAAVAARLCAAALGTDTMGSVRVPAAYCGVWGFKPTKGAISTEGVVPLSFTLDCVGPLARSAEDLAIIAEALLEPLARPFHRMAADATLRGLRLGIPRQLEEVEIAPEVAGAFARFLDGLRAADAAVTQIDLPAWQPGKARRAGLLVSDAEGLAYYTGQLGAELPGLSGDFASMLRYPLKAGVLRLVAAYETIEAVRLDCARAFAEIDLLALPTAPQTSFSHDSATPTNQADLTALACFARAPAVSVPVMTEGALPAGAQLVAAPGDDGRLLALAGALTRSGAAVSP
jgi:aspartyl-tRNA(Asn)/glutamyl-tRNA(Gln) amidotransferase subunit A